LGAVGTTARARRMQNMYEKHGVTHPIEPSKRWTHVAAMFYDREWRVIDCDYPLGCCNRPLKDWIEINSSRPIAEIMQHDMNVQILHSYVGSPFPAKYAKYRINHPYNNYQRENSGIMCSELISIADNNVCGKPDMVLPSHYQIYAIANGIEVSQLWDATRD